MSILRLQRELASHIEETLESVSSMTAAEAEAELEGALRKMALVEMAKLLLNSSPDRVDDEPGGENGVLYKRVIGESVIYVVRMGFNTRITFGPPMAKGYYEDCWCYDTASGAIEAAAAWDPEETPEPDGWKKHPRSGRYRPGGDASREYNSYTDPMGDRR